MEGIGGGRGEMCDGCSEMYAVSRASSRFLFRARFDEMDLAGFFFFFFFFILVDVSFVSYTCLMYLLNERGMGGGGMK